MLYKTFCRLFCRVSMVALLAACEAPISEPTSQQACTAAQFETLLWKPADAINAVELPKGTRIIRPGMAVTMDFRPDRLNIKIGESARVERVYCG